MHARWPTLGDWLRSVVRGWFQYHAVPDNSPSLDVPQASQPILAGAFVAAVRKRPAGLGEHGPPDSPLATPRPHLHPYPNDRLTVKCTQGKSRMR